MPKGTLEHISCLRVAAINNGRRPISICMSETAFSSLLDEVGWPTGYGAAMGGDVRVFDLDVMLHDDDDMGIRILWKP